MTLQATTHNLATRHGCNADVIAAASVGELARTTFSEKAERALDIGFASFLLLLCSPAFLLIFVGMRVYSKPPYLYRGTRLGLRRQPFTMYKFRTLPEGSETRLGAQLVSEEHRLVTRFAAFLRDTRLDELPQLFNVLRGEMTLIGPRPERPSVAAAVSPCISNYHFRFTVKPGLTGYAQLFTAHRTPKSIRARMDNHFIRSRRTLHSRLELMFRTAGAAIYSTTTQGWRQFARSLRRLAAGGSEATDRRVFSRHRLKHGIVQAVDHNNGEELILVDISQRTFRARSNRPLQVNGFAQWLVEIEVAGKSGLHRIRKMRCKGSVIRQTPGRETHDYVVEFSPTSDYSHYVLEQHLLRRSFAHRNGANAHTDSSPPAAPTGRTGGGPSP